MMNGQREWSTATVSEGDCQPNKDMWSPYEDWTGNYYDFFTQSDSTCLPFDTDHQCYSASCGINHEDKVWLGCGNIYQSYEDGMRLCEDGVGERRFVPNSRTGTCGMTKGQ